MAITGEERMPLLGGGTSVAIKNIRAAGKTGRRVPLIEGHKGAGTHGNWMTLAQIAAASSALDKVRIPLVSGGAFVTVKQVRDF